MAKNTNDVQAEKPADVRASEPATEEAYADPSQEIVEIFVERDPSDENPNLVIGINGKNWVMPRGETSKVPRFVADEYNRAREAQYKADKAVKQMRGIKQA